MSLTAWKHTEKNRHKRNVYNKISGGCVILVQLFKWQCIVFFRAYLVTILKALLWSIDSDTQFSNKRNIMKLIFSIQSRYSLSDPKAQSIVKLITESVQVENLRFLFNLPWTRHLFPEGTIQILRNHWTGGFRKWPFLPTSST